MSSTDTTNTTPSTGVAPTISTKKVIVSMPIWRTFEGRVDTPLHELKVEFFRHFHYERTPPEVDVTTTEEEANRLLSTKDGKPLYEGVHLVK